MKLLQITSPGEPACIETPRPEPKSDEVLLRVSGVTTCPHWDLHILDGEPMFANQPLSYPYTPGEPGHEAVGTIEATGENVTDFAAGQRVAVWRDPGSRRQGCYAQFAAIDAADVLPVPDDLNDADLAPLELAMCVQVSFDQLIKRDAVAGKRVGISGLGPAGLIAVQMANAYGAREVYAFDLLEARRNLAAELGADFVAHPDEYSADRHGPDALDAALDTTGLKTSIEFLMARTRETVAIFGVLRETVEFGPEHWWGDFALLGYGEHNRPAAERALSLVTGGTLRLAPLVTHQLPLREYERGVELLRRKDAIKILFDPWADT